MNEVQDHIRRQLLELLLTKVEQDTYPSSTMLDLIEELLTDQEIPAYVLLLQDKIRQDRFPSISLMKRLKDLVA